MMLKIRLIRGYVLLFSAVFATIMMPRSAEAQGKEIVEYLGYVVEQNWDGAVNLIHTDALARRHGEYLAVVQNSTSIEQERELLGRLGVETLVQLEEMAPEKFYVADRIATHLSNPTTAATIKRKRETLEVKFLGQGLEEDGKVSHVIVRSRQETLDSIVEELLMISCAKNKKGEWKIVPDLARPRVVPLVTREVE